MTMTDPEDCTSMTEIRAAIDALDTEIVTLLARRLRYIDAAARVKSSRDTVRDEARKADVIAKACARGTALDLPPDHVAAVYETLVESSIAHELRAYDRKAGA